MRARRRPAAARRSSGGTRSSERSRTPSDEVATTRSARLVTIVGDAGVGKSRLTAEFLEVAAGRAHALDGRCLPYGDGITFWPVAEAVRSLAGIVNDDDAAEARGQARRARRRGR